MQSKIAVLQVIPNLDVSGASQGCIDIANHLEQENLVSFIVTNGGVNENKLNNAECIFKMKVHTKNPIRILFNAFAISRIIKKNNISILHARSRAPAWSCLLASKMCNVKFVATFHGTYNYNNPIKKLYNSVMLRTHGTIAISEYINSDSIRYYKIKPPLVAVIKRGIDLNFFNNKKDYQNEINAISEELNIKNDDIKILLPGRITGWKGHLLTLKAIKKLNNSYQNIKLIFVGPDENVKLKNDLINFIEEHELQNNVIFTGSRHDINTFYALADLVITASTDPEAFGRVAIEAQAMGKFVIASNHGGSKETVIDNETGYLFMPNDIEDLTKKLKNSIDSEIYKQPETIRSCINHIKENFTKIRMCDETIKFYKTVLDK